MDFSKILSNVECQFLSCFPVKNIDWQQLTDDLNWNNQKLLLDRTYNHRLNKDLPISNSYQLNFLKQLIQHLERSVGEVHDEVYEAFCKVQRDSSEERFAYKHYCLPKFDTVITLKESRSFAANGTTGLCSWQASLALSDWLLHNQNVVKGKSVIELGSGTGLCGFIVFKCCKAARMTLTDGSPAVIDVLNMNRKINFPGEDESEDTLSIIELPWEASELVQEQKYDVILAADVVYDSTEFENLVNAIDHLFRLMEEKVQLVLAATVRNEDTLENFLRLLESKKFTWKTENVVPLEESYLHWDRTTEVRIMFVTRNTELS